MASDPPGTDHDPHHRHSRGQQHLLQASASLRQLLDQSQLPPALRQELAAEFAQLEALNQKLEQGDLHIAVFGKVSAGKSSLLNALLGRSHFSVSALHGETRHSQMIHWRDHSHLDGGVQLIDTPGINEIAGEERERLAHEVAARCDLILFVADGDLTAVELSALRQLCEQQRPVLLLLNKADRYTPAEQQQLLQHLRQQTQGLIRSENVLLCAADPRPETLIRIDAQGREQRETRPRDPDIAALQQRLWQILEQEGKSLVALNASLFAGQMSEQMARRITQARRQVAEKLVRSYCLAKGLAVAVNPIPLADLLAAAGLDVALVKQLSQIYGLPMSRKESGDLLLTICAQLVALMGAVWGVHLVSSALKTMSAGLSTALTAGAQGALAWYATYLVGRAAENYLIAGKSWGPGGPKQVVQRIVADLDRDSILAEAREEILQRLRSKPS